MYRLNNSKIILILCFILFVTALLILCFKLKEKFQSDYACQTECENLGNPITNCLCIKCCQKNQCEPLTNSILNFVNVGDTIDCKYLS